MATFLKIVAKIAQYGAKAVSWCWANKGKILTWILLYGEAAYDYVVSALKALGII